MKELTDEEIKAKLIQESAKTKGGALIIELITDRALTPMGTDPVRVQQQAGVFNLWLELKEYLEE